MPVMEGLTLCRTMRRDPVLSTIPFIAMSAEDDRYKMRQILQCGASAYINKPFHIDQLIAVTERLLSDHYQLILKEREWLENERRNMLSSISSLIRALEARDRYTRGHSDAVCDIVGKIAENQAVGQEEYKISIWQRVCTISEKSACQTGFF